MQDQQKLFAAKLQEMTEQSETLKAQIAALENADPDEVRQMRAHLEADWADTVVSLKKRAKAMRFLTGQQLSEIQLDYCRRAADILHSSVKQSWQAVAENTETDEMALYAEYAIDFAALAMRYALMTAVTAIDMQDEEERIQHE